MSTAYIPPGVTVQELVSSPLTPLLALPGSACLVGMSEGLLTRTDTIQLVGTTATILPGVSPGSTLTSDSILSITDATNPLVAPDGFDPSTDYTFTPSSFSLVRQVTSNTLSVAITGNPVSFTLTSGSVPAAGQVVRLTHSATTELVTVSGVVGQVVTVFTPIVNGYTTSGSTVTWGNIPDSDTLRVTYTYTPADYFTPIRLTSMTDVESRFGTAWNAQDSPTVGTVAGTQVNSPVSFAASMAFQNGATNVVLQPLYFVSSSTGLPVQPNSTQAAASATWSVVFNSLLDFDDINILIPVVGQSAPSVSDAVMLQIEQAAVAFVEAASNEGNLYVSIVGEDSSVSNTVAQEATLISHANSLESLNNGDTNQQMVFLNTSKFSTPSTGGTTPIGGQYVAAALAGMLSARSPAATLTRQGVAGINSVTDTRSLQAKNNNAANGMLVVENQGNIVWVRHGITMDNTSAATRELNVVRAKQYIVASVTQTLNTQVIGKVVADASAPTVVNNLMIGTLEDLRGQGILIAYSGVQSALTSLDPTTMAVKFTYQPSFVVNYITVTFSLDLTSGLLSVTSTST